MSEYIKREDAIKRLCDFSQEGTIPMPYELWENVLKDVPSADVVEVKHATWLLNGKTYCECSICHHQGNEYGDDKYCRHCGARMNGDNK